jgi:gamma-glutamylcyclotransferase (GGCT)/AIG2-like uncharacterized protein YtfP
MKETIEEIALRLYPDKGYEDELYCDIGGYNRELFIEGAKWQQERSYSEEDMIRFAEFVATYPDKNKNVHGQMLHAKSKYDGSERTIDLLEQFKNK